MNKIDSFKGQYRFLSNFWPSQIFYMIPGQKMDPPLTVLFPSVEHAYQAAKTLDGEKILKIAALDKPNQAKAVGQRLKLRPDWEFIKTSVMLDLVRLKFADPILAARLRGTRDAELIEGNTWGDKFWGVCDGEGLNWLGRILMLVRDEIGNA